MEKTISYQEFMENETVKKSTGEVLEAIKKDPVAMKMIDAAKTVEELYEATKRFITVAWEDFKKVFANTFAYYSSPKAALEDEVLDDVVGGWSFSGFFNSISKKATCIAAVVVGAAVVVAGAALALTCVAVAGPVGAAVGALAGIGVAAYGFVLLTQGAEGLWQS